MKVRKSIEIAAPAEKVWPFLVEPEKIKKWFTSLETFEYLEDQRSGAGTPVYVEERIPGRILTVTFVADEWVQNERIILTATSSNYPTRYHIAWSIEPTDSGSWFTFLEDFGYPYGIWGKILDLLGPTVARANMAKSLSELKRLVEAENSRELSR